MIKGYDPRTKHLFVYNKDFNYFGKIDEYLKEPCSEEVAKIFATALTSGLNLKNVLVINNNDSFLFSRNSSKIYFINKVVITEEIVNKSSGICFCSKPENNNYFDKYSYKKVYIQNYGDSLVALGYLFFNLINSKINFIPRRLNFLIPNDNNIDKNYKKYDENFETDSSGKMAYNISKSNLVLNQRYFELGESCFYNRVLFNNKIENLEYCYFLTRKNLNKLFNKLPLSYRYAASCIPIKICNDELFCSITNDTSKYINIRVLSQYDTVDMYTFIQFINIFSGKLFVYSYKIEDFTSYNNMYIYKYSLYKNGDINES